MTNLADIISRQREKKTVITDYIRLFRHINKNKMERRRYPISVEEKPLEGCRDLELYRTGSKYLPSQIVAEGAAPVFLKRVVSVAVVEEAATRVTVSPSLGILFTGAQSGPEGYRIP